MDRARCLQDVAEGNQQAGSEGCIRDGEVIEDYPDDYPFPSCLILGHGIHVVCGIGEGKAWIVTAYRPTLDKWEKNIFYFLIIFLALGFLTSLLTCSSPCFSLSYRASYFSLNLSYFSFCFSRSSMTASLMSS